MSIGFPPSYSEQVEQANSREIARGAVVYAFEALDWKYEEIDRDLYKSKLGNPGAWGEILTVSLSLPGVIEVESKCIFPLQIIDWGRNRHNVRTFIDRFSIKETRDLKFGTHEPIHFDNEGNSPVERLLKEDDIIIRKLN